MRLCGPVEKDAGHSVEGLVLKPAPLAVSGTCLLVARAVDLWLAASSALESIRQVFGWSSLLFQEVSFPNTRGLVF